MEVDQTIKEELAPSVQQSTLAPEQTGSKLNRQHLFLLILGFFVVLFGVASGSYYLGTTNSDTKSVMQPSNTPTISESSPTPSLSASYPDALGLTTWSLVDPGSELYMKQTISMFDSKVDYPNTKERVITKIFSEDEGYDPKEITLIDENKYKWTDILNEPIKDIADSISIFVSDRLFSFKKIPNTNNMLLVVDLNRVASSSVQVPWIPIQHGRDLYLYTNVDGKTELKKIVSFLQNDRGFTYPKIDIFSQDSRFVSLKLFACWNCGGHMPETYLLDLQTFKNINLGQVSYFSWKQNGNYEYKDYVIIECKEPQPGECSEDPDTLPLKTGKL